MFLVNRNKSMIIDLANPIKGAQKSNIAINPLQKTHLNTGNYYDI